MWEPCPLVHEQRPDSTFLLFRDDTVDNCHHWESRSKSTPFPNPERMVTLNVGERTLALVRYQSGYGSSNAKYLGMMDVATQNVIGSSSAFQGSGFDSTYYDPNDINNFDILVVR